MAGHRTTPQVRHGILEVCANSGEIVERIIVGSDRWFEWLTFNHHFYFLNNVGKFTARKEKRRNTQYWYAYLRIDGKLRKKYLSNSEQVTDKKLYDTAKSFGL